MNDSYWPARTCPSQWGIVWFNSLRAPSSTTTARTIWDKTVRLLTASDGWENLPERWRKYGQLILDYKIQPWLLTQHDYALIGILNKASQWEDAPTDDMERGISILMNPQSNRTTDEINFLLSLDRKYAIGALN